MDDSQIFLLWHMGRRGEESPSSQNVLCVLPWQASNSHVRDPCVFWSGRRGVVRPLAIPIWPPRDRWAEFSAVPAEGNHKMSIMRAYEEVIEFIAAGTSPSSVISFQPSEAVKERVAALIHRERSIGISLEEKSELDHYLQLEHLMRLAKARAHQHISDA
jgi:hypothetical protein